MTTEPGPIAGPHLGRRDDRRRAVGRRLAARGVSGPGEAVGSATVWSREPRGRRDVLRRPSVVALDRQLLFPRAPRRARRRRDRWHRHAGRGQFGQRGARRRRRARRDGASTSCSASSCGSRPATRSPASACTIHLGILRRDMHETRLERVQNVNVQQTVDRTACFASAPVDVRYRRRGRLRLRVPRRANPDHIVRAVDQASGDPRLPARRARRRGAMTRAARRRAARQRRRGLEAKTCIGDPRIGALATPGLARRGSAWARPEATARGSIRRPPDGGVTRPRRRTPDRRSAAVRCLRAGRMLATPRPPRRHEAGASTHRSRVAADARRRQPTRWRGPCRRGRRRRAAHRPCRCAPT